VDFAHCLDGVDKAVEKNLRDNKAVCMAYTLVKLGVLGKIVMALHLPAPAQAQAVCQLPR
jgi:hypothetical protein